MHTAAAEFSTRSTVLPIERDGHSNSRAKVAGGEANVLACPPEAGSIEAHGNTSADSSVVEPNPKRDERAGYQKKPDKPKEKRRRLLRRFSKLEGV